MTNLIYDKTEKGLEEIQTRKHHLASRMRSLLVLVDGKSNAEVLLKKIAGLGLTAQSIEELVEQGFIAPRAEQQTKPEEIAPTPEPVVVTAAVAATVTTASDAAASPEHQPAPQNAGTTAERFQAIYNFYTSTIKSTLGLRGYGLQLKVEHCANIDDFRALRQTYLDAVQKSQGPEMAISLGNRLDQLLAPIPNN